MYPELIKSIVENMNLSNREELIAKLDQANTPNPEAQAQAQQAQQAQLQSQLEFQASQTAAHNGQAQESAARAAKANAEAQAVPQELEIDRIKAITANLQVGTADDKEFQRRLEISKQLIKEREVAVKEGNVEQPAPQAQPQAVPPAQPQAMPQGMPQPMQPNQGELQ